MINRADRTNRQRQSRRRTGSMALIGALLVAAVCSTVAPSTAAATVYYDGAAPAESESEPESEAAVEDADAAPDPPATTEPAIETVASSLPG